MAHSVSFRMDEGQQYGIPNQLRDNNNNDHQLFLPKHQRMTWYIRVVCHFPNKECFLFPFLNEGIDKFVGDYKPLCG